MSLAPASRYLEVWLNELHVGWLCEADQIIRFIATEQYRMDAQRPTLSFSMTVPGADQVTRQILLNQYDPAIYRERGELPPFFAGLMPEGRLRRRLAATRTDAGDMDDFGILAAAGEDLPGAVKVVPADLHRLSPSALQYKHVRGGVAAPEGAYPGAASLAGVQDKLALSTLPGGQQYGVPSKGKLTDVIAKLPRPEDDSQVMNEYVCMKLASLAGVEIAQCKLVTMSELRDHPDLVAELGASTQMLLLNRFDRGPTGSIHMEDACQLLTLMPTQKYSGLDQITTFIRILDRFGQRGIEDIRQFFIRQAVNTLIGNSDAHLKNCSVLYRNGAHPELSPAYDILCTSALPGFKGFSANVAIDRAQKSETLETYITVATKAGIAGRIAKAAVRFAVDRAQESWLKSMSDMEVPDMVRQTIERRLGVLPLAKAWLRS